jgi:lipopolysaccharide heptosyltransferase II
MSQTYEQQQNLDNYGYPLPPGSRQKLRKTAIRASKTILGTCIYLVMSICGGFLWLSRLGKKYPPLTPVNSHPLRILVIRLDLIGDLVLSMTAVRALKHTYPEAQIDLLAVPASAKIVMHDPDLAGIITYDPNIWRRPKALIQVKNWRDAFRLLRRLRARHYDIAVSLYGPWAGVIAVLSGAQRCVGFGRESYPGFMTDSVAGVHWSPKSREHEVDYCLQLAQAAGATIRPSDRIPRLYVDPQAREQLEQLLVQEGVQPEKPLIACHVSSNNGQSKRWPIPYWATLIDKLTCEQGAQVVLTGTAADLPLVQSVTHRLQEACPEACTERSRSERRNAINLAGKTSLPQLAALLQRADLVISGDSGPMHIAAAVGTPLIAIHGPTDPALTGPVSPRATILRSAIWCSPCYNAKDSADCPFFTTQCMKNILPAQVFEVAQAKLKEARPSQKMGVGDE